MGIVEKGRLKYIVFDHLEKTGFVTHCFSTKCGGVSDGVFSSLNLGQKRGDISENVLENYGLISSALGFSLEDIVCSNQVHGVKVCVVGEKDRGNGFWGENNITNTDGFVTNTPNVLLTTYHADCVPLFFADPVKRAVGLAHAGWRGTLGGIGKVTILKMMKEFGSHASDILVGIGPSICLDSFQVDKPVAEEFENKLPLSKEFIFADPTLEKYYIDLWEINKKMLTEVGVEEKNIETSGLCTVKRQDLFYSHRVSGEKRGSQVAFIKIDMERK